jgi:hypothetical protein
MRLARSLPTCRARWAWHRVQSPCVPQRIFTAPAPVFQYRSRLFSLSATRNPLAARSPGGRDIRCKCGLDRNVDQQGEHGRADERDQHHPPGTT